LNEREIPRIQRLAAVRAGPRLRREADAQIHRTLSRAGIRRTVFANGPFGSERSEKRQPYICITGASSFAGSIVSGGTIHK
jgi:hypothetical protein